MKKKILSLFLVMCTVMCVFTGCSSSSNSGDGAEDYSKYMTTPEDVAKFAVESVIEGKAERLISLLAVDDTSFIDVDDIEAALPNSDFDEFIDLPFDKYEINTRLEDRLGAGRTTVEVEVIDKKDEYDSISSIIECGLTSNGQWGICDTLDNSLYVENYEFTTPGGETKCYIDGVEVPSKYIDTSKAVCEGNIFSNECGRNLLYNHYCIPAIGVTEKKITIKSNNFEVNHVVTANPYDSEEYEASAYLTLGDTDVCVAAVQTLFTNAVTLYENGASVEEYTSLVSPESTLISGESLKEAMIDLHSQDEYKNIKMTQCMKYEYKPEPGFADLGIQQQAYWLTDDIICVYSQFEIVWDITNTSDGNVKTVDTHDCTYSYLQYMEGEYKFYQFDSDSEFSSLNQYCDRWGEDND